MQTRVQGLSPFSESLLEPNCALFDAFIGVRAAATAAGQPGSEAACSFSATLQNRLIAGGFYVIIIKHILLFLLLPHVNTNEYKYLDNEEMIHLLLRSGLRCCKY